MNAVMHACMRSATRHATVENTMSCVSYVALKIACCKKRCSPCPVTTDAEQQVKGPGSIAAAVNHCLALQHHHGVPVSRSRRAAHHSQTMPSESNSVQHKDVIHETSSSFRVTTAKDQHQVGAPKDSCMIGPSPGDVSCALRGGPAACA